MGVIIDEIKEVMVTQLADLLDTKKQLDKNQTQLYQLREEMQENFAYYKESFGKITDFKAKCMILRESFDKSESVLFMFDESK